MAKSLDPGREQKMHHDAALFSAHSSRQGAGPWKNPKLVHGFAPTGFESQKPRPSPTPQPRKRTAREFVFPRDTQLAPQLASLRGIASHTVPSTKTKSRKTGKSVTCRSAEPRKKTHSCTILHKLASNRKKSARVFTRYPRPLPNWLRSAESPSPSPNLGNCARRAQ